MGNFVSLVSADGHELSAYRADPSGPARGGIVVLQEIFGVNRHIRTVCDRLAAQGYVALAPALFDRQVKGFESGYSEEEVAEARKFLADLDWPKLLMDTEAAVKALRPEVPVAVLGFCLGGSVAYLAAARSEGLAAAVCFYGGRIAHFADEAPRVPVQMHFGEKDHTIPMSDVETIKAKRPETEIHVYPAGHGFCCDERGSFDAESNNLAWKRAHTFLEEAFAQNKRS